MIRRSQIAPTDRASTAQPRPAQACRLPSKPALSVSAATGAVTTAAARNRTAALARRSTPPAVRFCQMMPKVIAMAPTRQATMPEAGTG